MKLATASRSLFSALAALVLLVAAFAAGFYTCLKFHHTSPPEQAARQLEPVGDAPADARAGVVDTLNNLKQAYLSRDPRQLAPLMDRDFAADADVLVLGSEGQPWEWVRGNDEVRSFIARDWKEWGTFRFDPAKALIWSSGNVAWMATLGTVEYQHGSRPIRFTAVLEQRRGKWVFRQMQFQWNDSPATASDLLSPETYLTLVRRGIYHFVNFAPAH